MQVPAPSSTTPALATPRPDQASALQRRTVSALLLTLSLSLLAVSAWLTPSPTGEGTHMQLGLPACGFLLATGYPCWTCGMTTAFTLAAHGRLLDAFLTQPAGAVLAIGNAALIFISAYTLVTGAPLKPLFSWLGRPWSLGAGVALFLTAWVYKILVVRGVL